LRPPEVVTLRDGSRLSIRPIRPDDKAKLRRGFGQLSSGSRRRRFLIPTVRLSSNLVAYLTEVDHIDHEALIAEGAETEEPIGVARYVRLLDQPKTAEVAVTVVDRWQRRGVATELLVRLAERARENGITSFSATCLASNEGALDLIQALPNTNVRPTSDGLVQITVELPEIPEPSRFRLALRHAAEEALAFHCPRAFPPGRGSRPPEDGRDRVGATPPSA
jgi:GNAT superfamily N-acetyltransferase